MTTPIHFYVTFNPHLNKNQTVDNCQAHDFYYFLKDKLNKDKQGYAYWGKIIGKNRESNIDLSPFKEVIETNRIIGHSTHLYITDFNTMWVGKVEDVMTKIDNLNETLPFYQDKKIEIWFKISDFTQLEHSPEETIEKISQLYMSNKYMPLHIDELSPYVTGVKYPFFVQDITEESYFDEAEKEGQKCIFNYNPGIENTSINRIVKSIHNFSLPEVLYKRIPHSAKTEIECAELDMLEQRHHNLTKVSFSYLKALEIILNDLVVHSLKRGGAGDDFYVNINSMPPKIYMSKETNDAIKLSAFHKNFSMGQIFFLVKKCMQTNYPPFRKVFGERKKFLKYVSETLPKVVEDNHLLEIRGVLAHSDSGRLSLNDAMAIRNIILGIGCTGIIHNCYQTYYEEEFKDFLAVKWTKQSDQNENLKKSQTKLKLVA